MERMEGFKCANCSSYLFDEAFQVECGDRFCGNCVKTLKYKERDSGCITKSCPRCGEEIALDRLYRDKAVEREFKTTTFKCSNQDCPWKGLGECYKEHIESCKFTKVPCPNKRFGCIRQLLKSQLSQHLSQGCPFSTTKCQWCSKKVYKKDLPVHIKQKCSKAQNENAEVLSKVITKVQFLTDAVVGAETTIQRVQQDFEKMALMVQTLQATSYSGTFIWKIPEVQRRRGEARSGRTVSLYSPPFYTGRHGYKMCLRLYMDGDGSGRGTHLSFFLTLMRGEYDALLTWPFRQTVTLTLLDQDRQKDIFQSFRPDPSSSSFQRPINDMNVASGCPKFAPLSVLDNPSYVKDDTIFLKADTIPLRVCRFSQPETPSAFYAV